MQVRQPAVAGMFYPNDNTELREEVDRLLLAAARPCNNTQRQPPKALIVPHAGYMYSGSTAANAYATLTESSLTINKVLLLGPSHRHRFVGLAVPEVAFFRTPLGDIPLDKPAINQLLKLPQVQLLDTAHQQEHSLEVQLPFLQSTLTDFTLIPLVVGAATSAEVHQVLDKFWGSEETLVVISSDLSHYHDYLTAQAIDNQTCKAIEQLEDQPLDSEQACGYIGIQALLTVAREKHMCIETISLCNSGDTAGDKNRVVGYGSWGVYSKG